MSTSPCCGSQLLAIASRLACLNSRAGGTFLNCSVLGCLGAPGCLSLGRATVWTSIGPGAVFALIWCGNRGLLGCA